MVKSHTQCFQINLLLTKYIKVKIFCSILKKKSPFMDVCWDTSHHVFPLHEQQHIATKKSKNTYQQEKL